MRRQPVSRLLAQNRCKALLVLLRNLLGPSAPSCITFTHAAVDVIALLAGFSNLLVFSNATRTCMVIYLAVHVYTSDSKNLGVSFDGCLFRFLCLCTPGFKIGWVRFRPDAG